jgi:hypothetical protein
MLHGWGGVRWASSRECVDSVCGCTGECGGHTLLWLNSKLMSIICVCLCVNLLLYWYIILSVIQLCLLHLRLLYMNYDYVLLIAMVVYNFEG